MLNLLPVILIAAGAVFLFKTNPAHAAPASCPYIAVFDPDRVEEQLEIAIRQYLTKQTDYFPEEERVEVTRLMSWFRGDFGGISGAVQMLKDYDVIPDDADPSVDFMEYDWTLELGNYLEL